MHTFTGGLLAATVALVLAAPAALASSVTPYSGFAPSGTFEGDTVGFRLKGPQTGNIANVYVGENDLGNQDNRNQTGWNWNDGVTVEGGGLKFDVTAFDFVFDTSGQVTLTLTGADGVSSSVDYQAGGFTPDTLVIRQRATEGNGRLESRIFVDPDLAGDYITAGTVQLPSAFGEHNSLVFSDLDALENEVNGNLVTGFDTDGSFKVTGSIHAFPELRASEATVFELSLGRAPAAVIPLPAAGWLLLSGLAGLGVIARRKRAAA